MRFYLLPYHVFLFLKSKNRVLTFCLTMRFFSKVRIEFLPFSLPYLFVCLGFWKVRIESYLLLIMWFFSQKDRALTFFLTMFVCFFVYLILFVCLGFWKVRITFLPFTYHVIFFRKYGSGSDLFSYHVIFFLQRKNRVLTFFLTLRIFFPYHVIFFRSKNWVLTFFLTMFVWVFEK